MTWGIPTETFLQIHVAISLIAMAAGIFVLYGLLVGKPSGAWIALCLIALILTSVTGFPLPPFGLDPPRIVGIISLVLLAAAIVAIYAFRMSGPWRWIFIVAALMALYLDVFVGVIQAFEKIRFLNALAPTQAEPPFVVAQVAVLLIFIALGFFAVRRFHPVAA